MGCVLVVEAIEDALKQITGEDFGEDAAKWQRWYAQRDAKKNPGPGDPGL